MQSVRLARGCSMHTRLYSLKQNLIELSCCKKVNYNCYEVAVEVIIIFIM